MKFLKFKKGFTLLELLVVISIIGILIAVGVASYSTAQKKSRDSRRKSDLKAIQNAMEQYYSVNQQYPPSTTNCAALGNSLSSYLSGGMPSDPKGGTYAYVCNVGSNNTYYISAQLEQGYGNASSNNCAGSCSGVDCNYFCVTNLQ
ncbi:MAG: prepilin-type N-terminal cleavage/methylation domain-containing protein [Candidatus Omnitrophica bacterium]|nr:prepilin-type N-terminal cleavage/methylation domain-containing protein [Candidatus Omnitrophota bacterium]